MIPGSDFDFRPTPNHKNSVFIIAIFTTFISIIIGLRFFLTRSLGERILLYIIMLLIFNIFGLIYKFHTYHIKTTDMQVCLLIFRNTSIFIFISVLYQISIS
jgi:hypothetical protein